jgi:hypothetical protein
MSSTIRGRCLCGAVRIALEPPTTFASHCHCESCRRAHAAAFVTWTGVPDARFRVEHGEDEVTRFASSPGAFRCFCRHCGTVMFTYYEPSHADFGDAAGSVYVPVAVLEDPLDRLPDSHVSFEEAVAWFPFEDHLPRVRAKSDVRVG